jgi:nucleotide-binding universal stress UspA family protein
MVAIWCTIAYEKPHALMFAGTVLVAGLAARWAAHNRSFIRQWMLAPVEVPLRVEAARTGAPIVERHDVLFPPPAAAVVAPAAREAPTRAAPRVLVATRGNPKLLSFALHEAKSLGAELIVLFVRHVAVPAGVNARTSDALADVEAQAMFADADREAAAAGVKVIRLYATAYDVGEAILDIAATHGVDTLILGASQRGMMWRTMKGDVIQYVAEYLPERINLLIHG